MIKPQIWQAFCNIEFSYDEQKEQPKDELTKEEEQIKRLNDLKNKGKLSNRKQKELSKMVGTLKGKNKPKKDEFNKRLQKAVREELKESSAVVSDTKTKRIGRQILLKIFYICFRVLREYPFINGFDFCVKAVEKHSVKADPMFLKNIIDELKTAFEVFEDPNTGLKVNKANKQLLILHAIMKISNEKSKVMRCGY